MSRKLWILLAVAAVALTSVIVICGRGGPSSGQGGAEVSAGRPAAGRTAILGVVEGGRKERRCGAAQAVKSRGKPALSSVEDDEDEDMTPADRALAERIEKALDDEDCAAALACAGEALKSPVASIRQDMVDTLGWFGEKALPELAPFLADADEDVRDSALAEWTMALAEIDDDAERVRIVELAMGILSDEDSLEDMSNEYIGVDEKLAVESLVRIIEGDGSAEGIEKAKETYEFVTGDEWTDVDAARRWIEEEYTPPDEETAPEKSSFLP